MHAHAVLCAGEMSATIIREPQAWTTAVSRLKADIVAGRDDASELTPNLKVGVSTNFNKLVRVSGMLACAGIGRPLTVLCRDNQLVLSSYSDLSKPA